MFRPFVTTKAQGTGLGLALVQKIVVTHNGRVTASAGDRGGARLSVTLPLRAAEVYEARRSDHSLSKVSALGVARRLAASVPASSRADPHRSFCNHSSPPTAASAFFRRESRARLSGPRVASRVLHARACGSSERIQRVRSDGSDDCGGSAHRRRGRRLAGLGRRGPSQPRGARANVRRGAGGAEDGAAAIADVDPGANRPGRRQGPRL